MLLRYWRESKYIGIRNCKPSTEVKCMQMNWENSFVNANRWSAPTPWTGFRYGGSGCGLGTAAVVAELFGWPCLINYYRLAIINCI